MKYSLVAKRRGIAEKGKRVSFDIANQVPVA